MRVLVELYLVNIMYYQFVLINFNLDTNKEEF